MINFKQIRYMNILSTGNAWTEIPLDSHKTTLILGENGAGKSTILDALSFALYGKAFRKINKPQLMNSINGKGLLVELTFTVGDITYMVKRGMKPNIFEIFKNGELIKQDAANKDYQLYLEENIIKMNHKSFGQVVVLGSSTFVPFMQLPAASRREIIEDLLDIQVFTTMNTLLKEKVSNNKADVVDTKHKIELVKTKIDAAKTKNKSIEDLKKNEVSRIKTKMKEFVKTYEDETKEIGELVKLNEALSDTIKDESEVLTNKAEKQSEIARIEKDISSLQNVLSFYEKHDNCPTCKQGIEHSFKSGVLSENSDKITSLQTTLSTVGIDLAAANTRLSEIKLVKDKINANSMKISEHEINVRIAKNSLKSLKADLENAQKEVKSIDLSEIEQFEDVLKKLHTKQEALYSDAEVLGVVATLLKDGGIKTRIVKQYIPVMNKLINKYLAAMDFFVDFQLDENFNETIKSRFRDEFSYSSFSEGEKLRIDLALLFTWRAISKLRNSTSTNLLIMDEIMDSSLDNSGTDEFLKIINELAVDTNIFIISHKGDQLYEKFDNVLRFEKVKNFSRIAA